MTRLRVLVVDDHPGVLAALADVLGSDPRLEVVGAVGTGPEAHAAAQQVQPDVVVLDVNIPGGGAPTARSLRALGQPPVIVALSAQSGERVMEQMLRAGATGYVVKGHAGERLAEAVWRCHHGEVVLASSAGAEALRSVVDGVPR